MACTSAADTCSHGTPLSAAARPAYSAAVSKSTAWAVPIIIDGESATTSTASAGGGETAAQSDFAAVSAPITASDVAAARAAAATATCRQWAVGSMRARHALRGTRASAGWPASKRSRPLRRRTAGACRASSTRSAASIAVRPVTKSSSAAGAAPTTLAPPASGLAPGGRSTLSPNRLIWYSCSLLSSSASAMAPGRPSASTCLRCASMTRNRSAERADLIIA
eukprot:scaffold43996_cov24-Tisochrysis_lutea.AAC.2